MIILIALRVFVVFLDTGIGDVNGFAFGFSKPSFVSDWKQIKSQAGPESEIVFEHGLNLLPYKVLVEVTVNDNGQNYTFHGRGSGFTDDDEPSVYGGIVYFYDEATVSVLAPNRNNKYRNGVVVYTGENGWIGPGYIKRNFTEAMVRVKVWTPCDLPEPDFIHNWTPLSVIDDETFQEIFHSLNDFPDLVVVQVKGIDHGRKISEAQGSTSRLDQWSTSSAQYGGVIFGFSNKAFRLWYPKKTYSAVCIMCLSDGWGNGMGKWVSSGHFRILAWIFSDFLNMTIHEEQIDNQQPRDLDLEIDVINSFIAVEVEALDGNNAGFRFNGVDSTVNDGDLGSFGGLIYAIGYNKLVYWVPKEGSNGYTINIGGVWGQNETGSVKYGQKSNLAKIRVKIFTFTSEDTVACPREDIEVKGTTFVNNGHCYNDSITYMCNGTIQHIRGDLQRTCLINGSWSGNVPLCTEVTCPEDEMEVDGTTTVATGHSYNDSITYTCNGTRQHIGGDLQRTCLINGSWSGNVPICEEILCPEDEMEVNGTTSVANGNSYNDSISYTCNGIRQHIGGDLQRSCLINGSWGGNVPICEEIPCPEDEMEVNGTTVVATGHSYNDSIIYKCNGTRQHIGGDLQRTCLINGSWSGNVPICEEVLCPEDKMEIEGTTSIATGNSYNDSITYTCSGTAKHIGGDLQRICLNNGSWSGNIPICKACSCPCRLMRNRYSSTDHQRLDKELEEIEKRLSVDKTKTSKFLRSRISAPDNRPSASGIGYVGVVFFVLAGLLLVVPDIPKLMHDVKLTYRHICCRQN